MLARQWTHVPYQLPGAFGRLPHIFPREGELLLSSV